MLHFWPDFVGTNIQIFEKILVKQHPAQGHCFLGSGALPVDS